MPIDYKRSITFTIPGTYYSPAVKVSATENNGALDFTVNVLSTSGLTADLRGLFFNFNDDLKLTGLAGLGSKVTGFDTYNVIDLGNNVNMIGYPSPFDLGVSSSVSDLRAAIQVFDTKQETYTYLKYCENYIVGYTSAGVQIIKGRCYFGGIRDIRGFIRSAAASNVDLGAELIGLTGIEEIDLPAYIGIHPYYVLPAFIRGMVTVGFPASITGVTPTDLGGIIDVIPPQDLPAWIKARLFKNLPARIHGWQTYDLGAYIDRRFKADLRGVIGVIETLTNMPALIKGWVREAYKDLPARIQGFVETYLPGFIRGTENRNLGARLVFLQPVSLPARIHGWAEAYLQGISSETISSSSLWTKRP